MAQINHIFNALEKQKIINKKRMELVMDIPPSTLGYKPNVWIASWENHPMTKDEIVKTVENSQEAYENGTQEAPSKLYIAVGYVLVHENVEHQNRKFKTYIAPTNNCRSGGWDLITSNKQFCPNSFWFPYYPWVAYAREILTYERGPSLPFGVADHILSFFDWQGGHKEQNLQHLPFEKHQKLSRSQPPEPYCHPPL